MNRAIWLLVWMLASGAEFLAGWLKSHAADRVKDANKAEAAK